MYAIRLSGERRRSVSNSFLNDDWGMRRHRHVQPQSVSELHCLADSESQASDIHVESLVRIIALRDLETEAHTRRVASLALDLARVMDVPDRDLLHIYRGALLHDIGKIGIPDLILHKKDSFTEEERIVMQAHPLYAYEILRPIPYLRPALVIPYCHHEKWDGTGYPRGLKGGQIPFSARLFAVVDVWDALLSDRPYRPAWTMDQACGYILEQSGKLFDLNVARTFLEEIVEGTAMSAAET